MLHLVPQLIHHAARHVVHHAARHVVHHATQQSVPVALQAAAAFGTAAGGLTKAYKNIEDNRRNEEEHREKMKRPPNNE
jgi:hypothetical protein